MIDPVTDLEINTKAQLNLLECCREYNPNVKIIFTSTRQIYGKPKIIPVNESHPINPTDINGINNRLMQPEVENYFFKFGALLAIIDKFLKFFFP